MDAGKLDQRVTIQEKSVTRAANGEEVITWVTHAERWARVEPIRGREFFAAAQMQGAVDYRVTIRYLSTVTRAMRLLWRGVVLDIVAEPIDVNARKAYLELMCVSGVRDV